MSKRLSDKAKPRTLIYTVAIDYPIVEATKPLWLRQSEISNCDFKVINKNYLKKGSIAHWNKYVTGRVYPNYDRYLFVDADTIPGGKFDVDQFFSNDRISVCRDYFMLDWIFNSLHFFDELLPLRDFNLDNYFNSGVIAYGKEFLPKIDDLLKFMEDNYENINLIYKKAKELKIAIGRDQTIINLYSFTSKWDLNFLPPTFNVQYPTKRGDFRSIFNNSSILHFNGLRSTKVRNITQKIKYYELENSLLDKEFTKENKFSKNRIIFSPKISKVQHLKKYIILKLKNIFKFIYEK